MIVSTENISNISDIQNIVCDMVIDTYKVINEVQKTSVNITIINAHNIVKFNERIESILNYVSNMYNEFYVTNNFERLIVRMQYLYSYISKTYNYREGTLPYKTINSILDIIKETWENIGVTVKYN